MHTLRPLAAVVLACQGLLGAARADDMEEVESSVAQAFADALVPVAEKIDSPIMKITGDGKLATGAHKDSVGLILVPQKDVKLEDKAANSDPGLPTGHLFMTMGFAPVIDGKPLEQARMRTLKVPSPDGSTRDTTYLALAVRHTSDDHWHLYAYGADAKPVLDLEFEKESTDQTLPLAIEVRDIKDNVGTAAIIIFGKNRAAFKITYQPPNT